MLPYSKWFWYLIHFLLALISNLKTKIMKKLFTLLILTITSFGFAQQNARGIKDNAIKQCGKCGVTAGRLKSPEIGVTAGLISPLNATKTEAFVSNSTGGGLLFFMPIVSNFNGATTSGASYGLNTSFGFFAGSRAFESSIFKPINIVGQTQAPQLTVSNDQKNNGFAFELGPQANFYFGNFSISPILNVGFMSLKQSEVSVWQKSVVGTATVETYNYYAYKMSESKSSGLAIIPKIRLGYNYRNYGFWLEGSYLKGPKIISEITTLVPDGNLNQSGQYTLQQLQAAKFATTKTETNFNAVGLNFGVTYSFKYFNKN